MNVLDTSSHGDTPMSRNMVSQCQTKQEAHRRLRSPEYQRSCPDFLSKGLIFVYQQPHHRINENQ